MQASTPMSSDQPPLPVGTRLFAALQFVIPKHWLSRLIYHITRSRRPLIKNLLLRGFLRGYRVNMAEAQQPDPFAFASFNDFFTRALRADARPIAPEASALASPVD